MARMGNAVGWNSMSDTCEAFAQPLPGLSLCVARGPVVYTTG